MCDVCTQRQMTLQKNTAQKIWSFPLRISSVNLTKSSVSYGFGHIYRRNPKWKTSFFVQRNINIILLQAHKLNNLKNKKACSIHGIMKSLTMLLMQVFFEKIFSVQSFIFLYFLFFIFIYLFFWISKFNYAAILAK